jgi:hypothetical protein
MKSNKLMTNIQENLLTAAVFISKYVHDLYDSKIDPESDNWYHGHFVGGVNPYYHQTNNCLIIEEYYHMPVSVIHTPIGSWHISGCGSGNHKIIKDYIHKKIGLKMICPGYQTSQGFHGPYWLVTSFNDVEVPHPNISLLPAHDNIDLHHNIENSIVYHSDDLLELGKQAGIRNEAILEKYLNQKDLFYKDSKEYIEYEDANQMFDDYLGKWLRSGLLCDKDGLSLKMANNPSLYNSSLVLQTLNNEYLIDFLAKIKPNSRNYVMSGTNNDVIFKLIYYSHLNNNSI